MTAAAALEKLIVLYRRMTGEERLAVVLDLHELSYDIAREGICHQHPEANADEVERLLHRRIELSRDSEMIGRAKSALDTVRALIMPDAKGKKRSLRTAILGSVWAFLSFSCL
jgi:hypothetical protein